MFFVFLFYSESSFLSLWNKESCAMLVWQVILVCLCSDHLCYRQESAIRLGVGEGKGKGLGPGTRYESLHTRVHYWSVTHIFFFTLFYLCILIIRISNNSKSFFYPNDFEIAGLDHLFFVSDCWSCLCCNLVIKCMFKFLQRKSIKSSSDS